MKKNIQPIIDEVETKRHKRLSIHCVSSSILLTHSDFYFPFTTKEGMG
jgi:hypothetical protein